MISRDCNLTSGTQSPPPWYVQDPNFVFVFASPVDPVKLNLPDYFDIVKRPMDLGTIRKRLLEGTMGGPYRTYKQFAQDVRLVWHNAALYNPPGTEVHTLAIKFAAFFERLYFAHDQRYAAAFVDATRNNDNCSLCAGSKFHFDAQTLYCNECTARNAPTTTARIKRGHTYYTNRSNRYHLCVPCYNTMKRDKISIPFDGQMITTAELRKEKNESTAEEAWVQCDHCQRWQHQICALHNRKKSESIDAPHYCPHCILGHMEARNSKAPIAKPVRGARDLPRSRLSDVIEKRITELITSRRCDRIASNLVVTQI
jgi:E1A/CREB-binding protein